MHGNEALFFKLNLDFFNQNHKPICNKNYVLFFASLRLNFSTSNSGLFGILIRNLQSKTTSRAELRKQTPITQ